MQHNSNINLCILIIVYINSDNCKLPNCLCPSTAPPLGHDPQDLPQLVLVTFDDLVSDWMYPIYEKITDINEGRKSANGNQILMTFFVSHFSIQTNSSFIDTNYELVHRLYNQGHEIASHTVT